MAQPMDPTTKATTKIRNIWGIGIVALLIIVGVAFTIIANRDHDRVTTAPATNPEPSLTLPNEGVSPNTENNAEEQRAK